MQLSAHPHSILLLGLCWGQMEHGEWQWVITSNWVVDSSCSCPTRCGLIPWANKHIFSIWYAATEVANAFFSILVQDQKQFAFSWQGQQYSFTVLPRGFSSPEISHNLVCRYLYQLTLSQDVTLVHYIDDIMLIGPNEWEVPMIPNLLVRHLYVRE